MEKNKAPARTSSRARSYRSMLVLAILLLALAAGCTPTTPPAVATESPVQPTVQVTEPSPPTATATQPAVTTTEPASTEGPATEAPASTETSRPVPTLSEGVQQVEETPPAFITGETPADLLAAITEDLAGRLQVDPAGIVVLQDQAFFWPDGSLGCPQPDQEYTQQPVDGYWVILEVGGEQFDYRATDEGVFFLCENPGPP
jgi:hypothetical protein